MKSLFLLAITENMRMKFYAEKTITAYVYWIKSYIYFNNKEHPFNCHDVEVESFLSYLANTKKVATKNETKTAAETIYLYYDA